MTQADLEAQIRNGLVEHFIALGMPDKSLTYSELEAAKWGIQYAESKRALSDYEKQIVALARDLMSKVPSSWIEKDFLNIIDRLTGES